MTRVSRRLIVNADDFGASAGVNEGVIHAFDHGIVTSASLMVRGEAATAAAALARSRPSLSLGLHVDLGEWAYDAGSWRPRYEVVPLQDRAAVAREVRAQLDRFIALTGDRPTHLDSHQHVHRRDPVRAVLDEVAGELGAPLRHFSDIRYCGDFYGQAEDGATQLDWISPDRLMALLAALPAGTTELCCHPAARADLDTMYRSERLRELDALCRPEVRLTIVSNGIELCRFARAAARAS